MRCLNDLIQLVVRGMGIDLDNTNTARRRLIKYILKNFSGFENGDNDLVPFEQVPLLSKSLICSSVRMNGCHDGREMLRLRKKPARQATASPLKHSEIHFRRIGPSSTPLSQHPFRSIELWNTLHMPTQ